MKKILVPTDFSPTARNAAIYAGSLAKELGAEICLLHVYTEPVPAVEGGHVNVMLADEVRRENKEAIRAEEQVLRDDADLRVIHRLLTGFKGETIRDVAENWNADLIVMGRRTTDERQLFGSTILKTIRKTDIPVLIVPDLVLYTPIKRVVLAVDFEEIVFQSTLNPVFGLVEKFNADVSVLHVEKSDESMTATEVSSKLQFGRTLAKVSYHYEKLENINVTQGILSYVDRHPCDLLVMIAHRHNFLERLFGNIHTASVSANVDLPLLVLKNITPTA